MQRETCWGILFASRICKIVSWKVYTFVIAFFVRNSSASASYNLLKIALKMKNGIKLHSYFVWVLKIGFYLSFQ